MLVTQYEVVVIVTIVLNCSIQHPGCIVVVVVALTIHTMHNILSWLHTESPKESA